ncbi:predicted protein [Sclerotinia sclerotiorum 1980 UF-70]|uniref:Uncharacterized protein n=2 Tax=Sclerotinia sclerotiorum (strain ATCC 18683 / 1980 / Ss-1) TaxID=665079 RepID=A7EZC0_SCLS1|nr:predicted protein [Sclerotinia sclerotiorum 1980 UF-70]APA12296.1 hypothetical protein sscle_09g070660 [Sclerotinia sclerotiorum 1980 UF-70]EDN94812.1 predicted protein [Sclerotinia sclerotiorum 1980 UF-70]
MATARGKELSTGVDSFVSYPSAGDPSDDERIFLFLDETNPPKNKDILQKPRARTSAKQPLAHKPTQGKEPERTYGESPLQAKQERGHSKKTEKHETNERSSYHHRSPARSRSKHNINHNIASQSASHFEEASTAQGTSGQHRAPRDNSDRSKLDREQISRLNDRFGPHDQMQRAASIPMVEPTNHGTPEVNQFNNSAGQVYDGYGTCYGQPRYKLKNFPTETYGYYKSMLEYQKAYLSATDQCIKAEHRRKWDADYSKLKGSNGIFLVEVPLGHPLRRAILLMDTRIDTKMSPWEDLPCAPKP